MKTKVKLAPYAHKRFRGWDFLPQCESYQMFGKPGYTYKRFYSTTFELRAFRQVVGLHLHFTTPWSPEEIKEYEDATRVTLENTTETVSKVHSPLKCMGAHCTIHNLSDHIMRSFPQHWRGDRGIMERICPHGIGHPDPDEYKLKLDDYEGVHGCDGCCRPKKKATVKKSTVKKVKDAN